MIKPITNEELYSRDLPSIVLKKMNELIDAVNKLTDKPVEEVKKDAV